ncbi:hypothetical protein DFP72DRAFT_901112, partial [Ephemerocybe angulata]
MYISWKCGRASSSSRYAARRPYASTPSALPLALIPPVLVNVCPLPLSRTTHSCPLFCDLPRVDVLPWPCQSKRLQLANTRPTHANLPFRLAHHLRRTPVGSCTLRQFAIRTKLSPSDSPTLVTESHSVHCWPLSLAPRSCILRVRKFHVDILTLHAKRPISRSRRLRPRDTTHSHSPDLPH